MKKDKNMRIAERFKRFADNRKAIRELSELDDQALSDLGIARSHIRSAVLGGRR
jgi:uncharacterized protein YjiS (DUF1127 family)